MKESSSRGLEECDRSIYMTHGFFDSCFVFDVIMFKTYQHLTSKTFRKGWRILVKNVKALWGPEVYFHAKRVADIVILIDILAKCYKG